MLSTKTRAALCLSALVFGLIGCKNSGDVAPVAVNAAINTAIAVAASGISRSRGGCYAICIDGTVCNPDSGLCERRTCARGCGANQFCNRTGETPMCEERVSPDLLTTPPSAVAPPPIGVPPATALPPVR